MNDYLILFHNTVKASANKVNKADAVEKHLVFSQEDLYNRLFAWQSETYGTGDIKISGAQISRWLNGKEAVPEWIAVNSVADREECRDQYGRVFREYVEKWLFQSSEKEARLMEELLNLLEEWRPRLFDGDGSGKGEAGVGSGGGEAAAESGDLADILAMALTTALAFDYSLRKNTLSPPLSEKLQKNVDFCRDHNFAFKTPYILAVLLENSGSLLWRALNKASADSRTKGLVGGGDIFGGLIRNYRECLQHGDAYEEVDLDKEKLLVAARALSYQEGKCYGDEFDLCCSLWHFQSGAISQMQPFAGKWWSSYETWKQLLTDCQKNSPETSDLYFYEPEQPEGTR